MFLKAEAEGTEVYKGREWGNIRKGKNEKKKEKKVTIKDGKMI